MIVDLFIGSFSGQFIIPLSFNSVRFFNSNTTFINNSELNPLKELVFPKKYFFLLVESTTISVVKDLEAFFEDLFNFLFSHIFSVVVADDGFTEVVGEASDNMSVFDQSTEKINRSQIFLSLEVATDNAGHVKGIHLISLGIAVSG